MSYLSKLVSKSTSQVLCRCTDTVINKWTQKTISKLTSHMWNTFAWQHHFI